MRSNTSPEGGRARLPPSIIKDGWLLVYEHTERPPVEQLVGELCIVMTDDDRCLTRILRKGRLPGRWDLLTANNEQELDVALRWAAMVTMILPYVPSEAEAQHWMAKSATSSAAI